MEKNVVLSPISCFLFALWKQNNDIIYRSENALVRTLYLMHLPGEARRQRDVCAQYYKVFGGEQWMAKFVTLLV